MKRILLLLCAALCTASCAVQTTYIGKAYPATDAGVLLERGHAPRPDGGRGGRPPAPPQYFGTLEKAQEVIEQRAREKGADAVVFEGIGRTVSEPTYTTTEHIQQHEDGSSTRTATTQRNVTVSDRLEATFLKYRE